MQLYISCLVVIIRGLWGTFISLQCRYVLFCDGDTQLCFAFNFWCLRAVTVHNTCVTMNMLYTSYYVTCMRNLLQLKCCHIQLRYLSIDVKFQLHIAFCIVDMSCFVTVSFIQIVIRTRVILRNVYKVI